MKKVLIFYGLLVIAVVIFLLARGTNFNFGFSGKNPTAKINNKTYKLILAKTDSERIKGLSGRSSLVKDTGMLFIFDKKGLYAFWMKDMKIPIDMLFINDNKIITVIENASTPTSGQDPSTLPIYKPTGEVNYVLEINANESSKNKFKEGDNVIFTGVK